MACLIQYGQQGLQIGQKVIGPSNQFLLKEFFDLIIPSIRISANGISKGVYSYVFGRSCQLLKNKFFDPGTPSMRKEDDREKKKKRKRKKRK